VFCPIRNAFDVKQYVDMISWSANT